MLSKKNNRKPFNMKLLQSVVRDFVVLGLGPHQLTQKYPINRENVQELSIQFLAFSHCSAYLFLDAKTFEDYTLSVYVCTTLILLILVYMIFMWKNRSICELIVNAEKMIDKRE